MVKSNGQQLIKMMSERGGTPSDYSDIVFGTVLKVKPLEVQLANDMVLTEDFLLLGKHIGKFKIQGKAVFKGKQKMSFHGHTQDANISKAEINYKKDDEFYMEVDSSLEKDDKLMLIRLDGGQQFYILERIDKKNEYGF